MPKLKSCNVCTILNSDLTFSNYINVRLKNDIKIAEVREDFTSSGYQAPSKYFLEEHKKNCLKDFILPISQEPISITINKNIENAEIKVDWDVFDSLSFAAKDSKYHEILNRIYYSQLISLDDKKPKVRKDDITILKTLNDLIYTNNLNISDIDLSIFDNDTSRNKLELLGLDLMQRILEKGIIDPKYALEIVKLNLKSILDLDCWNPQYKVKIETPEERAARMEDINLFIEWKKRKS